MNIPIDPIFFANQFEFREWLEAHHLEAKEIPVGYYKKHTQKPSMTWSESVDQALCFGWIDGIRKSIDAERYCIRFTPRKKSSIWSKVNIQKVEILVKKGLMKPAGLKAFSYCKENKSGIYSFESETAELCEAHAEIFMSRLKAWKYFNEQPPSYRKMVIRWIKSAKQEKTQLSRLEKVMTASEKQVRWGFGMKDDV